MVRLRCSRPGLLRILRMAGCIFLAARALAAIAAPPAAISPPSRPSLDDVQAVYLFDFVKFTRWAGSPPDGTIDMCIAGQHGLLESLKRVIAGETINGHSLIARAVHSPAEITGCDLLYISSTAEDAPGLLRSATGKPMLLVGDGPGLLDRGGMIQFVVVDDRVRFAVNLEPVTRSGLALSSELLKVALRVQGPAQPGGGGAR